MSDLDTTIEELEAEVKAELAESKSVKKEAKSKSKTEGDEVQDLGPAVTDPEDKDSGPAKSADKAKKAADPKAKGSKAKSEDTETPEDTESLEEEEEKLEEKSAPKKEAKTKVKAEEEDEDEDEDDDEDEEEMDESTLEDRLSSIDFSDDVSALTENEDLSEEFKSKAKTVFEAAIKSKLRSEIVRIESDKKSQVAEEVEKIKTELTEKVDAYMNYVVEEWMKQNEIALERGLKGEISEDFISGLKALFEEHYIDVPDEKYDILGQQSEKIDDLEKKLNEQIEKNASMKSDNSKLVRESVFSQACSDLTDTEADKFKGLVEDVEFSDEESFKTKLDTLKESYFPKAKTVAESVDSETSNGSESYETGAMAAYMSAISRDAKANQAVEN